MDSNVTAFKANNPSLEIEEKDGKYIFKKLWNDDTFVCIFKESENFAFLNNIILPEELICIFHKNEDLLEYIFAPIPPKLPCIQKKFTFNFNGISFECYFSKSTKTLEALARSFIEIEDAGESQHRNLRVFRDYFLRDTLHKRFSEYFKDKEPISFFVKGEVSKIGFDFVKLSKHINFYLDFFDRNSPYINIITKKEESVLEDYKMPCYSLIDSFPKIVNAQTINPIILDIILLANRTSNIRLKYLFYYQILEFCSYYYLDADAKKKLTCILSNPDISSRAEGYSNIIIEQLRDYVKNRDDSSRLKKIVTDCCDWNDIKLEINENMGYFSGNVLFDGGFKLDAIMQDCNSPSEPSNTTVILKNVSQNMENIRNVLVHLRESRENEVILPTKRNDNNLKPYLFLLRRIAEKVAIRFEQ